MGFTVWIIEDNSFMHLDKQLKALLKEYGINTLKLSKLSGAPNSTFSDWLGGSSPKNISQVKIIADYFSVSIDFLCFGENRAI